MSRKKAPLPESLEAAGKDPLADKGMFSKELFCREFVIDRNATRAVVAAGYSEVGTHSAKSKGYKLLQDPAVKARIERLLAKRLEQADITADRVMMALARQAFGGDMRDLFDADGEFIRPADWNDDLAESILGVEVAGGKIVKVRRGDRNPALAHLARHFKIVGTEIDEKIGQFMDVATRLEKANARYARMRKESKE